MLRRYAILCAFGAAACGGSGAGSGAAAPNAVSASMVHSCGDADKLHHHELDPNAPGETVALVPCSKSGGDDYSGVVHIESESDGLHVRIDATDDDYNEGVFGSDLKGRDAVLVYPKGRNAKAVEVELSRTKDGYHGEKVISYDDLDNLNDEGARVEVGIFDHDDGATEHEELHVQVAVSAGESCEKAIDENPQVIDGNARGLAAPDLTDDQLAAPVQSSTFFSNCPLADSAHANICVAIKEGKPLGVSVKVSPSNKGVAACIDRATRKLHWPENAKLDVVHQTF
ncbi:MAG TPA: hypothetical protein VHU80_15290 [Polyangiaceae bacterium]|jgi:hypothetical protein|nr:hypothetical protein [Polyangiaceae bacterium]